MFALPGMVMITWPRQSPFTGGSTTTIAASAHFSDSTRRQRARREWRGFISGVRPERSDHVLTHREDVAQASIQRAALVDRGAAARLVNMLHGFHGHFYYVSVGREEARLLHFGESPFLTNVSHMSPITSISRHAPIRAVSIPEKALQEEDEIIGPTLTFLCTSSVRCYAYLAARGKDPTK
jgi:hypothetical protein